MEETVSANLRLGHERSQEGRLVQLGVAERGTVVVVAIIAARARSTMHCDCIGYSPIGSSEGGTASVFPSGAVELCLCCGAKNGGERVRRE